MKGEGPIVLTRLLPSQRRVVVEFPPGRTYYLFRGAASGPVVAEIGEHDAMRRVSVRLAGGTSSRIDDGSLTRIAYARLVRKGLGIIELAHGPQLGLRLRGTMTQGSPCVGGFLGYLWEVRAVSLATRVGVCRERFENELLEGTSTEADVELRLTHAWDLPWATFELGLVPGASYIRQDLRTSGLAPARNGFAGQLFALAAASHDFGQRTYVGLEIEAGTYFLRRLDPQGWSAEFNLRSSVFAGLRW